MKLFDLEKTTFSKKQLIKTFLHLKRLQINWVGWSTNVQEFDLCYNNSLRCLFSENSFFVDI